MNVRWLLLYWLVLAAAPAVATGDVYTLTLTGGLPGHRDMELFLDADNDSVKPAFALAPQFNKVLYTVDASGLAPADGKLAGPVVVTITSDGYNPPDGYTDVCTYKIDAKVARGKVGGSFSGTHTRTGTPALPQRRQKEKDLPASAGPQRLSGAVTGTVTSPRRWGRNVRFALYLDNARAQPAPQPDGRTKVVPRWNLPGFLRFTTSSGKADVATVRGFGGHPNVMIVHLPCEAGRLSGGVGFAGTYNHTYFDAESAGLKLAESKLTGSLDVTVNPDPYVPPDGKPLPCKYTVGAKVLSPCEGFGVR